MSLLRVIVTSAVVVIAWTLLVLAGALRGWWLEPLAPVGDAVAFDRAVVARIDAATPGSVAVVRLEAGAVHSALFRGVDREIDAHTLFPVASLGKWITAYGVLLLAQDGRIALDAPVSTYLERWQLPEPAPGLRNDAVTVRRLLSHTAGFTDGLGFADYSDAAPPPDLLSTLAEPLASSGAPVELRVNEEPGVHWDYSGGSYLILELLVEDVTGMSFADYMAQAVFAPIGMVRSTYAPLSTLAHTSGSWTRHGATAPLYRYAAKGATGLATTVSDLARFARALQQGDPLEMPWVDAMRTPLGRVFGQPIWGAGAMLFAPDGQGSFVYGHDGANEPSINATVRIDPSSGDGFVALSTGPAFLASDLGYEWVLWRRGRPDFLYTGRALESGILPLILGLAVGLGVAIGLALYSKRRGSA